MPRGRPRKPARVLEMSGAFRKNPARRRARAEELAPQRGLGEPPEEWTREEAVNGRCAHLLRIWRKVVEQDQVLHVLNCSHWLLVKNLCLLQYKIERANEGHGKATSSDYTAVKASLAAIGQTPVDSSRVAEAVRVPNRDDAARRQVAGWGEFAG